MEKRHIMDEKDLPDHADLETIERVHLGGPLVEKGTENRIDELVERFTTLADLDEWNLFKPDQLKKALLELLTMSVAKNHALTLTTSRIPNNWFIRSRLEVCRLFIRQDEDKEAFILNVGPSPINGEFMMFPLRSVEVVGEETSEDFAAVGGIRHNVRKILDEIWENDELWWGSDQE